MSLGHFFSEKGDIISCSFNGATIRDQLITGGIINCGMNGTTIENSVLLSARIFSDITNTHFNNVSVSPPNGNPPYIWVEKHSILDLRNFKNNTVTNCRWQYLQLISTKPTENLPQSFCSNSFINNTFGCTRLIVNQNSYEGVQIKGHMTACRNGALMINNDFAPVRWGGFPCVDHSRSASPIKVGITVMWVAIPLFVLLCVGILVKQLYSRYIAPKVEAKRQQQFRSDFRALVDYRQYLQRDLRNLKNYQSGMMKIVRNSLYQMHESGYDGFPQELFEMLLNYFPQINLENPNLAYREELAIQRRTLRLTLFSSSIQEVVEEDARIEFEAEGEGEEDILLRDAASFEYQTEELDWYTA